jgi:hypothetical protein
MQCQELTLMDNLGYKAMLLMNFLDFCGTVTAVITVRYNHLPLKLFLPVRGEDYIPLQVIALLVCQLDVVPTITPARRTGDNMVTRRVFQFYVLST